MMMTMMREMTTIGKDGVGSGDVVCVWAVGREIEERKEREMK
jgi:hypothetical protein